MFHGTRSAYAKGRLCISIKSRIGYCRAGPRRLAGASTFELRLTSLSLTRPLTRHAPGSATRHTADTGVTAHVVYRRVYRSIYTGTAIHLQLLRTATHTQSVYRLQAAHAQPQSYQICALAIAAGAGRTHAQAAWGAPHESTNNSTQHHSLEEPNIMSTRHRCYFAHPAQSAIG